MNGARGLASWSIVWLASIGAALAGLSGCESGPPAWDEQARSELMACGGDPIGDPVAPPPGTYQDQGIALDWDKLVPPHNPIDPDQGYVWRTMHDSARTEQVYHDATHGDPRAAWYVCITEAAWRFGGRHNAHRLAGLACKTVYKCSFQWSRLPYSSKQASGRRLLTELGRAFDGEAVKLQIRDQVIAHALSLVMAGRLMSAVRSSSGAAATRGSGGSGGTRGSGNAGGRAGRSVCFAAGTPVVTRRGAVAIEEIQPGDRVACADVSGASVASAAWTRCVVQDVIERDHDGEVVRVRAGDEEVVATGDHPFRVAAGEDLARRPAPEHVSEPAAGRPGRARWVDARYLRAGDQLIGVGGRRVEVVSARVERAALRVYNLHVAPHATYAVGARGVLVHNRARPASPPTLRVGRRTIEWRKYHVKDVVCKQGCEQVARAIQNKIGGRIGTIRPNPSSQAKRLTVDGRTPEWGHHQVVVKDGRVYDLLTGPEGQAIDVYKARFPQPAPGEAPPVLFDF